MIDLYHSSRSGLDFYTTFCVHDIRPCISLSCVDFDDISIPASIIFTIDHCRLFPTLPNALFAHSFGQLLITCCTFLLPEVHCDKIVIVVIYDFDQNAGHNHISKGGRYGGI